MNGEADISGPPEAKTHRRIADEEKDYEHCEPGQEWVRGHRDLLGHWHKGYCRRKKVKNEFGVKVKIPGFGEVYYNHGEETDRTGEVANNEDGF
jgi:hypothetical protein